MDFCVTWKGSTQELERTWRRPPPFKRKALICEAGKGGEVVFWCMDFLASKISALVLKLQIVEQSHWDEITTYGDGQHRQRLCNFEAVL